MKLEQIKRNMMQMGQNVESALDQAIKSLVKREIEGFKAVHLIEKTTNQFHIQLDDECLAFLAMHGPVAKDLRLIFSIIKINSDLERMGDQAVNVAHIGKDYMGRTPITLPAEIEEMSHIVQKMVRDSLDSFVREDLDLAREVLLLDNKVDERRNKIFKDLMLLIRQQPENVEAAMDVILIARNLERVGDHATNIAEDVIFIATGKDIRHGGQKI
ncbi:MAG: phosphate signaling complex protein PhoU [Bdellovibrionaceae bacterium]|nr:phosphate signaling complex protein PhoU [Pseudobdellovibrionaceae bacterium]